MSSNLNEHIALKYLNKDSHSHIDMLQSISSQKSDIILASSNGVLLHDKQANLYLLSVDSKNHMDEFLNKLSSPQLLSVHQDYLADEISKRFKLNKTMICKKLFGVLLWIQAFLKTKIYKL